MRQLTGRDGPVRPPESIGWCEVSGGTETSQYSEEEESTEIPQVVVSERGGAQTLSMEALQRCGRGVVGPGGGGASHLAGKPEVVERSGKVGQSG